MNKDNILSYILRGKNHRIILLEINKGRVIQPQLVKRTDMYRSHITRTISELLKLKLIVCTNPSVREYKFYKITTLGKDISKKLIEILNEIN